MNYFTVLYLFIFIIYFFKNDIFSNIINFNKKYNVPNLLNNISTIFKNYEKINYKYLVLIILSIYVFLNLIVPASNMANPAFIRKIITPAVSIHPILTANFISTNSCLVAY